MVLGDSNIITGDRRLKSGSGSEPSNSLYDGSEGRHVKILGVSRLLGYLCP